MFNISKYSVSGSQRSSGITQSPVCSRGDDSPPGTDTGLLSAPPTEWDLDERLKSARQRMCVCVRGHLRKHGMVRARDCSLKPRHSACSNDPLSSPVWER